jgi:hypothetical protein
VVGRFGTYVRDGGKSEQSRRTRTETNTVLHNVIVSLLKSRSWVLSTAYMSKSWVLDYLLQNKNRDDYNTTDVDVLSFKVHYHFRRIEHENWYD